MEIGAINQYQNYNYNYFQAKPVHEREAKPIYGGENFFVNPPTGYTEYVPQDLFNGNTVGLSGLVASNNGGNITQNLPAQAGYAAGTTTVSFIG